MAGAWCTKLKGQRTKLKGQSKVKAGVRLKSSTCGFNVKHRVCDSCATIGLLRTVYEYFIVRL